jgi:predicted amidophosphoribosyltransferase
MACIGQLVPARGAVPAVFAYEGVGRQLLVALKYHNGRSALPWLGRALSQLVVPASVDVATWAPTHASRRRGRGFDQAELLARSLARVLGLPCRSLLRRTDRAGPQTGRVRTDRLTAPAFMAVACSSRVLVVDDVVTTGATLRAAAAALTAAGATAVVAVTAGATPRPGTPATAPMLGGSRRKG